jgi:hypothetical protein
MKAESNLTEALRVVVDKIDATVRSGGYEGAPIDMILAGGLAMHHYSRSRYTHDIDASFSRRIILPVKELTTQFVGADGKPSILYFDNNYNPTLGLMHPDYEQDSKEWQGIGNEQRIVKLRVIAPVDLALSKISRFSEQDREDIMTLAKLGLINAAAVRDRAKEAMKYYVGNKTSVLTSIDLVCRSMAGTGQRNGPSNGPAL